MTSCPTCGAPTYPLDPIGGVDGPAVVECEAGHQTGAPIDVSNLLALPAGGAVTFTPVLPEPPQGVTPGMLAKLGGWNSRYDPADWLQGSTVVPIPVVAQDEIDAAGGTLERDGFTFQQVDADRVDVTPPPVPPLPFKVVFDDER